jgi:hypothetical protein
MNLDPAREPMGMDPATERVWTKRAGRPSPTQTSWPR